MIYKGYEFSLSLSGTKIVHIARNAAGNVIFRESSEKNLKKVIDRSIEEKQRKEELEAKERAAKAKVKAKKQKRGLFAPPPKPSASAPLSGATVDKEETKKITRGPDGKFISKSQLVQEEPRKKNIWQKLIS